MRKPEPERVPSDSGLDRKPWLQVIQVVTDGGKSHEVGFFASLKENETTASSSWNSIKVQIYPIEEC